MHDTMESFTLEHLGDYASIGQLTANEGEAVSRGKTSEARLFQMDVVVRVQIVEANHLLTTI